ncbi:MAG TPA: rRNA adenine N-6-methyltransferase family protein [Nitrososphaera sp.]|nr:rRNA adenine N-6-methyltransferase family protein [Nitrososphaera sp.]
MTTSSSRRRRQLGQHMLVDEKVLAKIISAADINRNEIVCEAGTGLGALTGELCKHAAKVISFEVDRALFAAARENKLLLSHYDNLSLVLGDPFKRQDLAFDVFMSNLPYSRSRDAMEWLATQRFDRAVVMLQKEFAEKLSAAPGDKDYRAISALAGHCFRIAEVTTVGKESFSPQPSVDSVVLKIIPVNKVRKETVKILNLLFSSRNKKAATVAARAGVSGYGNDKRIDQLSPADLVELAVRIGNNNGVRAV